MGGNLFQSDKRTWISKDEIDRLGDEFDYNEFHKQIFGDFEKNEAYKRAFDARMAYEKYCMAFCDRKGLPSTRTANIMKDYAIMFETTIEEMNRAYRDVERELEAKGFEQL